MNHYILRDGEPVAASFLEWAHWFGTLANRVVAQTKIGPVLVSTIFLGIDHSDGRQEAPILWETMIFTGNESAEQWRHSSRAKALALHERAVAWVEAGMKPEERP